MRGRPLTQAQKDKMAAGRRAARQNRAESARVAPAPGVDYAEVMERGGHSVGTGFAKELSQALGEFMLAHQQQPGSGKQNIPPALFKRRMQKWREMEELLSDLQAAGERPLYELGADLFADDILVPAFRTENGRQVATRIRFDRIPNETMVPKNEPARRVMALYMEAIGGKTPDLGDQTMEAYLKRPRIADVVGAPLEEPAVMSRPRAIHEASVEVLEDTPPEERTYLGVRKVLGTVQPEMAGKL